MTLSVFNKIKKIWYATTHHTRKNNHLMFYMCAFIKYLIPDSIERKRLPDILSSFYQLSDEEQAYIKMRVDYYCKFNDSIFLPKDASPLNEYRFNKRISYVNDYINSTYFFDAYEYIRFFSKQLRWAYNPGDVFYLFPVPEITKSRPITSDDTNRNNILLNLDKVRHFTWIYDPFKWEEKECRILFRGDIKNKPRRIKFIETWKEHPLCDVAPGGNMSIYEHLRYKYIMSLEGNDVASNLKWVMSSNSVAVMPRPTCETWYMEGKLIPNYHYIEISNDYHDLIDRIMYYETHPEEARDIVKHAHEWVEQFRNKKREKLISLMVLNKYFDLTGQQKKHTPKRYIVNDYVRTNDSEKINAQNKAREDVTHTLQNNGYDAYNILNLKYSWGKFRPYHHYPFITQYISNRQAKKLLQKIKRGDIIFIQDFHLKHMQYITTQCIIKQAKVVYLIHDIQSIRYGIVTNEVAQLNNASILLVHTQAMAEKLHNIGVLTPMRITQIFDYYSSSPIQPTEETLKRQNEIVFAGNLTKSEFISSLGNITNNTNIKFKLYGFIRDAESVTDSSVHYCGVFQPEETNRIKGGWGLIWDGNSIDTCGGHYGEYLRYNVSHKTSLYLACGLPIIVWEQSSIAEWVIKENIGITVPNLHYIDKYITEISKEDYRIMILNAQNIGTKLRHGEFLKKQIKDIQ